MSKEKPYLHEVTRRHLLYLGAAIGLAFAASIAAIVAVAIQVNSVQQEQISDNREALRQIRQTEARQVGLLCDVSAVVADFIAAPPDRPRDRPALERLRADRCLELRSFPVP